MDILTTVASLPRLAEKLASADEIGLDYETTSYHPSERAPLQFDLLKPVGWGFAFPDGSKTYVPVTHQTGDNVPIYDAVDLLRRVLSDPTKTVWAHNAKFEAIVTRVLRIESKCQWRCSLLAQWLLGKGLKGKQGHGLKAAVQKYLKHKMLTWEEVVPVSARAHEIAPETMAPYCADDALQGLFLGNHFMREIRELGMKKVFVELECPVAVEVLPHMDEVGVAINSKHLTDLRKAYQKEMVQLAKEFIELCGVDIGRDQLISRLMYDKLRWWPVPPSFRRGKSGLISVDKGHRQALLGAIPEGTSGHKALRLKDRYQLLSKIVSTYTQSLINKAMEYTDRRLRCNWLQQGTATGRFSSSDPNLQNIPIRTEEGRVIREAFVAESGWTFYDRDYSGADLRVFAHLAKEETMIRILSSENDDLHQATADMCRCGRFPGKIANLGLIYEMGYKQLAKEVGCSEEVGRALAMNWHQSYPGVKKYHLQQHLIVARDGYVRTITNRIRRITAAKGHVDNLSYRAKHESTNTPTQGSVADIIKIAMRNLVREWKERGVLYDWYTKEGKAKLCLQIHDELLVELRDDFKEEGADDVRRHMENAVKLRVPLKTDGGFGRNWLEAH